MNRLKDIIEDFRDTLHSDECVSILNRMYASLHNNEYSKIPAQDVSTESETILRLDIFEVLVDLHFKLDSVLVKPISFKKRPRVIFSDTGSGVDDFYLYMSEFVCVPDSHKIYNRRNITQYHFKLKYIDDINYNIDMNLIFNDSKVITVYENHKINEYSKLFVLIYQFMNDMIGRNFNTGDNVSATIYRVTEHNTYMCSILLPGGYDINYVISESEAFDDDLFKLLIDTVEKNDVNFKFINSTDYV